MNLGEKIYKLRTEKNLSQGDLAEALNVSRQSISKWENNSAVPELDKLIKLSEIFCITLDELVRDKQPEHRSPASESIPVYVQTREKSSSRKTAGTILLCFGMVVWLIVSLFGGILAGLILASPFVGCGLICLLACSHTGLWCAWCIYSFIDLYLRFATGVNWHFVFVPAVYTGGWTVQLLVAWGILIAYGILTVITVLRFRKAAPESLQKDGIAAAGFCIFFFLAQILSIPPVTEPEYIVGYRSVISVTGWLRSGMLVSALVFSVRFVTSLYRKKKMQ